MESNDLISAFADAVAARVIAHLSTIPSAAPPAAPAPTWMRTAEAAAYVKLSTKTLETKRRIGGGPGFECVGRRIRYLRSDLDKWLIGREAKRAAMPPPKPRPKRATSVPPSPRDLAIVEAHEKGLSYGEIGKQLGITRQRAQQIAARGRE